MRAEDFWQWFTDNADRLAANPDSRDLISALDRGVSLTWPQLGWEIGPDPSGDWYFALSPNLNRALHSQAKEAVRTAPEVMGWRFYAARQRKAWDGRFTVRTRDGIKEFNSTGWRFVLLRYPDAKVEVVLVSRDARPLEPEERRMAAAVVVEGMLGEEFLLESGIDFALEIALDARLDAQSRPMSHLAQALGLA